MKKIIISFFIVFGLLGTSVQTLAAPTTYEQVVFENEFSGLNSLEAFQFQKMLLVNRNFLKENPYSHIKVNGEYYEAWKFQNSLLKARQNNMTAYEYLLDKYEPVSITPVAFTIDMKTGQITGTAEVETTEFRVISIQ